METNRLNNFKNHLEQYKEKFTVINEDNLITATSVKFTEPTIEEKELELIKFHQQMLKNNNIQLMNKFKETKRNEIKKYKESHRKKEFNKPITPYRQEIINTLKNPANGFNLALTLNFNPVNLSGLFNLQMVQNKVDEWWKLYCAYTLGRDASKYKTMNYIGFVEHFESNIHAHLSIKGIFGNVYSQGYKIGERVANTRISAERKADILAKKPYNDKYKHSLLSCEEAQKGSVEAVAIAAGGLYKEYKDQKLGKNTISESIADLKADAYGIYKGIFNSKGNCDELVQEKYKKHFGK